jgi:hypothetical protein
MWKKKSKERGSTNLLRIWNIAGTVRNPCGRQSRGIMGPTKQFRTPRLSTNGPFRFPPLRQSPVRACMPPTSMHARPPPQPLLTAVAHARRVPTLQEERMHGDTTDRVRPLTRSNIAHTPIPNRPKKRTFVSSRHSSNLRIRSGPDGPHARGRHGVITVQRLTPSPGATSPAKSSGLERSEGLALSLGRREGTPVLYTSARRRCTRQVLHGCNRSTLQASNVR